MMYHHTIGGPTWHAADSARDHAALRLMPAVEPVRVMVSASLGQVTFQDVRGQVWFKGGHNDWTGNMVICIESRKRCLVLLSNDVRAERIYPELTRAILGQTRMPWTWEYEWLKPPAGGP